MEPDLSATGGTVFKAVTHFCRILLLLLVAMTTALPPAESACFYPHSRTTKYYAYLNNGSNTFYSCTYVIISPPMENYTHWDQIGERTVECDGSISSWGDTTTCTGSGNTTLSLGPCDPICD